MIFWIIQGLGIFALIFYSLAFQMKTKEKLLIMQVISNVFSTAQYLLAMAFTGAVQTLLGVVRGIVFYFYKKRDANPDKIVLIIFAIAIIVGTILTWDSIFSCLPLIGMLANLYGQWQNNMKRLRIFAVISAVLWTIYAFYTGVYTGMLSEILKIVSSMVGIYRFKSSKLNNINMCEENEEKTT